MSTCLVLSYLTMLSSANLAQGAFVIGEQKFEHEWHSKKSMPAKRSDMSATTVDDAIYLVGGCALDQAWDGSTTWGGYSCGGSATNGISASTYRYFPKTNTFDTTLPDAPRPRYRHAAAAVNKKIYLFGGVDGPDKIISEVDVLDTVTGLWTTRAQKMPNATTDLSAFVHSGKVYTVGGYDATYTASNVTQVFEPDASSPWSVSSSLVRGRGDHFAAVVDDKAYVVGGFHHENSFGSPVSSLEMMDIGAGTAWASRKAMNISRGDKAVAVLNKMIHVVGGETKNLKGHSVPLHDVEVYDPLGDTWYFGGDIPSKRFRFAAAAHGASIFIFGGQGYLVGTQDADGSKYPLMDTVEQYSEKVSPTAQISQAVSPTTQFGFISVVLSTLVFSSC